MAAANWGEPSAWPLLALVPYEAAPLEACSSIGAALAAALCVRVAWLPPRALPHGSLDAARAQRHAAALLGDLAVARRACGAALALGVTAADLFQPELPFAMGAADASQRCAVVSLARLHTAPRAAEEAVHQAAHALGVGAHCYDGACAMRHARGAPPQPQSPGFCARHAHAARSALLRDASM